MTLTRDLPADVADADAMTALDELRAEYVEAGGDHELVRALIENLPDGAGYRLTVTDEGES